MVIRALDHVRRCDTAEEGVILNQVLRSALLGEGEVRLSFDRVYDLTSSFANTSIVALLDEHSETYIKSHLRIVDATQQIADMIRRCLANGIRLRDQAA